MKLTVVMSVYNGEKYLEEQLSSLRLQKRQADEVLIFDDLSLDSSADLVADYIKKNGLDNWKLIRNEKNKGWKRNFVDGLERASGDLIFPCDQDDIWLDDKLQECETIMSVHPEIDVLTTNYVAFYPDGRTKFGPEKNDGKIIKQVCKHSFFNIRYPGCTYCFRSRLLPLLKKYKENDFPHDAILWRFAMFKGTLYSYHKPLIRWRKHNDSAYSVESSQARSKDGKKKWLEYADRFVLMMQKFVVNENCDTPYNNKILSECGKWIEERKKFYDTQSFISGIKLIKYIRFYSRIRQYFGDWYLCLFK